MDSFGMLMGSMERGRMKREMTDDQLIDRVISSVVRVEKRVLKKSGEIIPFVHLIMKCKKCNTVFFYHAPIMGTEEFAYAIIGALPKVATVLVKSAKCPEHGSCRYVGYVFSSPVAETKKKDDTIDRLLVVSVTTKKGETTVFKINSKQQFVKHDKLGNKEANPLINIFDVSHWDTDDPMFG